ncbi:MAG TPA: hypothetical protein DDZ89_19215 [Clostridiales bacterium]|nr:hypothetical protein [Clostridiales bacterium]
MTRKKTSFLIITAILLVLVVGLVWYFVKPSESEIRIQQDGIATRSCYQDPYEYHKALEALLYEVDQGAMSNEDIAGSIEWISRNLEDIGAYYETLSFLNEQKGEETIGAVEGENPIGGGRGYKDIKRTGKYSVKSAAQFVKAVANAKEGDVIFVQENAKIDLTDYMIAQNYTIRLKDGVTLASDRGRDGSEGGIIFTTAIVDQPMIDAGNNVRITGLVIQGPDAKRRDMSDMKTGAGIFSDGSGVTIDNCEISGFGYAAIELKNGKDNLITNNYIHHNRNINTGYGIRAMNATVGIESNLFNHNNVSIFGEGGANCSLEIVNNVEMGENYSAFIQMGSLSQNEEVVSGGSISIRNNTYMSRQNPFAFLDIPQGGLQIKNNYFGGNEGSYDKEKLYGKNNKYKEYYDNNRFGLLKNVNVSTPSLSFTYTADMNRTGITNRVFYGDVEVSQAYLRELQVQLLEEADVQVIKETIEKALVEIEKYDRYYQFIGQTWFERNGDRYGAIPDDSPLGGGYGYQDIITDGDYIVETKEELLDALSKAKSGEVVFIKGDAVIDLTTVKDPIAINDGVTLASDRGKKASTGAFVFSDSYVNPMFNAGADVRITGITFKGADSERRIEFHARTLLGPDALGRDVYYKLVALDCIKTVKDNLEVDNCEFSGFSHSPVFISGGKDHHIHHNFLHHNQRQGLGYGVCLDKSTALIEYNLMNANRHDIAGTGAPGSGYQASNNVQMGISLSHCFDMHGGRDRGDGTDIAGKYVLMFNNLFLSDEYPYYLRGTPTDMQEFYNNAIYNQLGVWQTGPLYGTGAQRNKIVVKNNLFNVKAEGVLVK